MLSEGLLSHPGAFFLPFLVDSDFKATFQLQLQAFAHVEFIIKLTLLNTSSCLSPDPYGRARENKISNILKSFFFNFKIFKYF